MSVLVTADLHLSENSRDAYRFSAMKTLRELVSKYDVDTVLVLGDLTEEKDNHSAWLVNKVVDEFHALSQNAEVIIQKGNHDYKDVDNPFFAFLQRMEGITWINKPTSQLIPALGDCLFLPHTSNWENDWDFRSDPIDEFPWIFTHQCYEGATGGFGHKLSGVPLTVFPKGAKVISGDVHVPQSFGCLTYVGAPYLVDFGDDYDPRVLILSNKKMVSVPVPGPQKRLVEFASITDANKSAPGVNKGDILKVRVCVSMKDYAIWHEYQERVRGWGERHGYQIHQVVPVVTSQESTKRLPHEHRSAKSDEEILRDYAQTRGVDAKSLAVALKLMSTETD